MQSIALSIPPLIKTADVWSRVRRIGCGQKLQKHGFDAGNSIANLLILGPDPIADNQSEHAPRLSHNAEREAPKPWSF
jgi:hypothetical protein